MSLGFVTIVYGTMNLKELVGLIISLGTELSAISPDHHIGMGSDLNSNVA